MDKLITIDDIIKALEELKLIHNSSISVSIEDDRDRMKYPIREIYYDPDLKKVVIR